MTTLSLRRLSKIVKALDGLITETRDEVNRLTSVTINVHDELESIHKQVNIAGTGFDDVAKRFITLLHLRASLRMSIGKANHTNGVNNLVTELQSLNTTALLFDRLKGIHNHNNRLDERNLSLRVEAARSRNAQDFNSYGSNNDTLVLSTLTDDSIEWILETLSDFKFTIQALTDKLEKINTSVELELAESVIVALINYDLIPRPEGF